jgi:hypothetical protein
VHAEKGSRRETGGEKEGGGAAHLPLRCRADREAVEKIEVEHPRRADPGAGEVRRPIEYRLGARVATHGDCARDRDEQSDSAQHGS